MCFFSVVFDSPAAQFHQSITMHLFLLYVPCIRQIYFQGNVCTYCSLKVAKGKPFPTACAGQVLRYVVRFPSYFASVNGTKFRIQHVGDVIVRTRVTTHPRSNEEIPAVGKYSGGNAIHRLDSNFFEPRIQNVFFQHFREPRTKTNFKFKHDESNKS